LPLFFISGVNKMKMEEKDVTIKPKRYQQDIASIQEELLN